MIDTPLHGVLVVDKPPGPTSHDVVACVRRALQTKRVGHLGTLDPLATGVLPLVVGRATRLASLYTGATKQYNAVIQLGLATDTCDTTGTVVTGSTREGGATGTGPSAPPPSRDSILEAASSFVGSYLQRPPEVSAKKIGGVRAYELARQHRPVVMKPVPVTLETLTLLSIDGAQVRCRLACSSGFYVRALARDLGARLGCGGCLEALRRERHGRFELAESVPLAQILEEGLAAGQRLVPLEALLPALPSVIVTDHGARRASHGNPLGPADLLAAPQKSAVPDTARVRVLDEQGRLLAIAERRADGALHPKIVLV